MFTALFDKYICDDEECGGGLDVNGVCTECGRDCEETDTDDILLIDHFDL